MEEYKTCPHCGATIRINALKCRFCNTWLKDYKPTPVGHDNSVQSTVPAGESSAAPSMPDMSNVAGQINKVIGNTMESDGIQKLAAKLNAMSPKDAAILSCCCGLLVLLMFLFMPMWSWSGIRVTGYESISRASEMKCDSYPLLPIFFIISMVVCMFRAWFRTTSNYLFIIGATVLCVLTLVTVPIIPISINGYIIILICLVWAFLEYLMKRRT